jgi:hypothetical protein
MYSSIQKVDLVAETAGGTDLVQTDHRRAREIEEDPELSVLFAIARVVSARNLAAAKKMKVANVVYVPIMEAPPSFLLDALGAVGAMLETMPLRQRTLLTSDRDPAELVDHNFRALSEIVCDRFETEEPLEAMDALEEDVSGAYGRHPDDDNEIEYWTAVLELMAVTGEIIRSRVGGSWVLTDDPAHGVVPFGFKLPSGALLVPGNRAMRSLEEGAEQGMHALLHALDDFARPAEATTGGPVLPSLRSKAEAESAGYVFRPLFEQFPPEMDGPVICYGHDSPRVFSLIRTEHEESIDHEAALENLRGQDVSIEEVEVAGSRMLSIGNSYFATEKILDRDFMRGLAKRLGSDLLGCAIQRRHVLLVMGLIDNPHGTGLLARIAANDLAHHPTTLICKHIVMVQDGVPVGLAMSKSESPFPVPGDDEPPKKKGFFSRLFGRGSST